MKRYTVTVTVWVYGHEDQAITRTHRRFTRRGAEARFDLEVFANDKVLNESTSRFLTGVKVILIDRDGYHIDRWEGSTPRYLEDLRRV